MKQKHADVLNSFFRIPTPENAPLRNGLPDMIRVKTRPICAKCCKQWPDKVYTITSKLDPKIRWQVGPLYFQVPRFTLSNGVLIPGPGITDERVMEEIMTIACNKGVGHWAECVCGKNWNMECRNDCVMTGKLFPDGLPSRPGACPCICTCVPGCGNEKKYPCRCGYAEVFHYKGCPVGNFRRDSSFYTTYVRSRMMKRSRQHARLF